MNYGAKLLLIFIILTSTASATDNGQLNSGTIFNFSSIGVNITVLALQNFSQLQYPASPANTLKFTINGSTIQFNATTDKTIYNITRNSDVVNWSYTGSGNLIINATMQYLNANYSLYKEGVIQYTNLSSSIGAIYYTLSSVGNYSIRRVSGVPALIYPSNQSTQTISPFPYDQSFTWSNESSTKYHIQVAKDSAFTIIASDKKTETNQTLIGMIEAAQYFWRVRTFDGISTYGNWSNSFNFELTQTTLPSSDGTTGIQGIVYEVKSLGNVVIPGARVTISNSTWTDSQTTVANGYYLFKNLANNSNYALIATKLNYENSNVELVTTINGTWKIKNIYMQACVSGFNCFYNQKYVSIVTKTWYGAIEPGILLTVYKPDSADILDTKTTDPQGSAPFLLLKDQAYRVVYSNTTNGINGETTVYPRTDTDKLVILVTSPLGFFSHGGRNVFINTDVTVTSQIIDATTAYINISYVDAMAQTTGLTFYINQTNASDPINQTVISSQVIGVSSNYTASFIVTGYKGEGYIASVKGTHTTFGAFNYAYGVHFKGIKTDLGIDPTTLLFFSIGFVLFIAALFGQSTASQGALIVCGAAWFFYGLGWFDSIGINMGSALTLASLIAVWDNFNNRKRTEMIQ